MTLEVAMAELAVSGGNGNGCDVIARQPYFVAQSSAGGGGATDHTYLQCLCARAVQSHIYIGART
jgi:hypothetical protein